MNHMARRMFELIEPIVAELTAPPALDLVDTVIPTQDDYLHPGWGEQQAQMQRLMDEAARVHHFRLVLERYESPTVCGTKSRVVE